jgi:agmatine deiminase
MKKNADSATHRTPAEQGFRMPAEWEPHAATWLAWPHEPGDWPGKLAPLRWVYGEVVRHLAAGERVRILINDAAIETQAKSVLAAVGVPASRVELVRVPTNRSWTRDTCPIFVRRDQDGEVALTDWKFNGWAKYANHRLDDAVPAALAKHLRRASFHPTVQVGGRRRQVVLEGGSIDVDGQGTLLTTEECLLDTVQARNPGVSREAVEQVLGEHLGVRKVLWLGRGIAGDDTHGHVDDLARFVRPGTVVIAQERNPRDPNHRPLRENWERLARMRDAQGTKLEVIALPMPAPVVFEGTRLPASYANFYIGNEAVIVPTFNDPADREALGILAELFPDRRVVGIHAVDLVWGLGTLHCMTQQEPVSGRTRAKRAAKSSVKQPKRS